MEEYIKKLLEQIRFEKAHKAIGDEIRSHIEDQVQENISEGMDEVTAEKRAVEDMGDPVEAGMQLDKVHRPQIAFGVIIVAIIAGVLATIVNILLCKDFDANLVYADSPVWGAAGVHINSIIFGIVLMLIMYLIDYTTVAKYSKVMASVLLVSYVIYSFAHYKMNVMHYYIPELYEKDQFFDSFKKYQYIDAIFYWFAPMIFLMVPLFAGILYKQRNQKYRALIESLIWIAVTGVSVERLEGIFNCAVIVICMLVELTVAIKKEWIKVPKIPTLASVWTLFTVVPAGAIWLLNRSRLMEFYQRGHISLVGVPKYAMKRTREIVKGMELFGSGMIRSFDGRMMISTKDYVRNEYGGEYVLSDIMALWGLISVLIALVVVAALIVLGLVAVSKIKNQLGLVMGSGCMMWLMVNAAFNACVGFGIIPACGSSFFPFFSSRRLIASYTILGIILSIYKYKNAYAEHVDIKIHRNIKKLEV